MDMKTGNGKLICPHCGEETLPRTASRAEGWRVVPIRVCMLCGGELEAAPSGAAPAGERRSRDRLSQLLGGEALPETSLSPVAGADRFCRVCVHCLEHPFRIFCELHRRDVDPMGDCPDFEPRKG